MPNDKDYLQDYDVKTEEIDDVEAGANLNKDIIIEQTNDEFSAIRNNVIEDVEKNESIDLDEYFE